MCPFSAAACMGVVPFLSTTPSSNVEVALTQSLPDEADEKAARLDEKGDARSLRGARASTARRAASCCARKSSSQRRRTSASLPAMAADIMACDTRGTSNDDGGGATIKLLAVEGVWGVGADDPRASSESCTLLIANSRCLDGAASENIDDDESWMNSLTARRHRLQWPQPAP